MTPERKDELRKQAQQLADLGRHGSGATYSIVLLAEGDMIVCGAQCPTIEVFRQLLQGALESLNSGTATLIDKRGQ